MGIYAFLKSAIVGAGTGVADFAPVQSNNIVPATLYGSRRNVQRQFNSQAPAFVKIGQDVLPVSILGNSGIAMQGTFELTQLAKEGG